MSRASDELENAGLDASEAATVAVPESGLGVPGVEGLTTGGGAEKISHGYLHTTHPDTGNEVVFVPGEALPEWARKVQAEQQAALWKPAAQKAAPTGGRKSIKTGEKPADGA